MIKVLLKTLLLSEIVGRALARQRVQQQFSVMQSLITTLVSEKWELEGKYTNVVKSDTVMMRSITLGHFFTCSEFFLDLIDEKTSCIRWCASS